jgi:hypothetical protein
MDFAKVGKARKTVFPSGDPIAALTRLTVVSIDIDPLSRLGCSGVCIRYMQLHCRRPSLIVFASLLALVYQIIPSLFYMGEASLFVRKFQVPQTLLSLLQSSLQGPLR